MKIARTADVPTIIRQLASYRRWANPRLIRLLKESKNASTDHLHASLALLPDDASQEEYLFRRLLNATPTELPVLRDALSPHRTELIAQLWSVLDSAKSNDTRLLPSASAWPCTTVRTPAGPRSAANWPRRSFQSIPSISEIGSNT